MKKAKLIIYLFFVLIFINLVYAFQSTNTDLLFYYNMDDAGAIILDIKDNEKPSINLDYDGFGNQVDGLVASSVSAIQMTSDIANISTVPNWASVTNITVGCFLNHTWGSGTVSVLSMYDQTGGNINGIVLYLDQDTNSIFMKWGDGDGTATTIYETINRSQYFYYIVRINSSGTSGTADIFMNDTLKFSGVGEPISFLSADQCLHIGSHDPVCDDTVGNKLVNTGMDECFAVNRSLSNSEITDIVTTGIIVPIDLTPSYFNFTNNASANTKLDDLIRWDVVFTDDISLASYIFENNFTGVLGNKSSAAISGVHVPVSENLTVNISTDGFLCGRFYFFDDGGNENVTNQSCFFTFEQPVLSTVMRDTDKNAININLISENKLFDINANFTKAAGALIGGVCNFTAQNLSSQNSEGSTVNFTLTSSNQLNLTVDEGTDNLIQDIINFKICRTGGLTNVEVFVNDTLNFTIAQGIIPSCGSSHEEKRETTDFLTLENFVVSIRCPGCTGGKTMIIISDDEDRRLSVDREYSSHFMPLAYNATTELYSHGVHIHKYTKVFNNLTLDIRCNESISSTTLSIGDISPNITIISIDDTPFTSGMQVESNESTTVLIEISGDIIRNVTLNITYENGSVIKSVNTETITLNQTELNINGIYNISVFAIDDDGNISTLIDFFQLNDTTSPVITWSFPNTLNTSGLSNATTRALNITINDVNLFAYEVLIFNPLGEQKLNTTSSGLSVTSFDIDDSLLYNETGIWKIQLAVSDDHTDMIIPSYDFEIYEEIFDKKSVRFDFEDIIDNKQYKSNVTIDYIGKYVTEYLVLDKLTDRYTFEYVFDLEADALNKDVRHRFRIRCEDIFFRDNSEYTAHFVCFRAKKWVDFESPDVNEFFIEECGDDCYEIELITNTKSEIKFNSIGGLNIIQEDKTINVTVAVIPQIYNIGLLTGNWFNDSVFDAQTTAGALIYIFMFIILVALIFFAEHFRIPAIMALAGIFGFFYGLLLYVTISGVLGIIFIFIMIMYIIRTVMFT